MQHYLPLASRDEKIKRLFESLIKRHLQLLAYNPYASAFGWKKGGNEFYLGRSMYIKQHNYELDSVCYPLDLGWRYWKATGNTE